MAMTQTDRNIHELIHVERDIAKALQVQNSLLAKILSYGILVRKDYYIPETEENENA